MRAADSCSIPPSKGTLYSSGMFDEYRVAEESPPDWREAESCVPSMPLPFNIGKLMSGLIVEWERLELKRGWNPLSVVHTLCAFANDFHNLGGGFVLIGVAECPGQPKPMVVGLSAFEVDTIQKEILQLGNCAIRPPYHPAIAPYQIDGWTVLVIWALGGQARPYKARLSLGKDGRDWGYFIRKGSSTVRAKERDELELMSLAATVPFDDRINLRARVDDLSRDLIRAFLRETRSDLAAHADTRSTEDLGRQLRVLSGPAEAMFPVNVGLLFFNPEPHKLFPVTQIDVVWFPEGAGGDKFTEKIFYGPLHLMAREALNYIRRNYIDETVIKHPDRAEATRVKNFPYAAIEECVINALYHRSYEEREPVEVRISPDELIVLSYPGPDRSVRLAQLRAGRAVPRRYRNRRIGEFLKELKLTEGRSTGVPKIIRAMSQNGSPPPEFEFDEDYSYFMVRLPVHPEARAAGDAVPEATVECGTESALSRHQVEILRKCTEDTAIGDLMSIAGRADRTKFRNQILRPLIRAELLRMTIPEKPNSRLQKYHLTQKGRACLAARANDAE